MPKSGWSKNILSEATIKRIRAVLEVRPTDPNSLNSVKIEIKRSKIYSAKGTNSLSPKTRRIDAKIRMKK